MITDLLWNVTAEITPANAPAFRLDREFGTVWIKGTLSVGHDVVDFVGGRDRRLGEQTVVLRVPARLSATEGIARGSQRFFHHEILLLHRGMQLRIRMSSAQARQLLAAVGR